MTSRSRHLRFPFVAFSLVEVVMAVGVVSFCLVALIGVLSIGFRINHYALSRESAIRAAELAANALRSSRPQTNGAFLLSEPYQFVWKTGDPLVNFSLFLSKENEIVSAASQSDKRLDIAIRPPETVGALTSAFLVVAWPGATAKIDWDDDKPTIRDAQGYETLRMYFLSR